MKNYKDCDYASNKFSDGFVYRFADRIVEITCIFPSNETKKLRL